MQDVDKKPRIKRINGYLHRFTPVFDNAGKFLNYVVSPVMVEFKPRDLLQVIIGASVIAVPVAFTEETWKLGETLPLLNVVSLSFISLFFIGIFAYFNFYRFMLKNHVFEFCKRVFFTYFFSLFVVGVLLTIIQKCPWEADYIVALKRVMIVGFPASMGATISDTIK